MKVFYLFNKNSWYEKGNCFCFIITGVIITLILVYCFSTNGNNSNDDIIWFEKPGDIIDVRSLEVFQVIDDNFALVHSSSRNVFTFTSAVFLLTNDEGKYYYDEEIIEVPYRKVVRQVGIYKYQTRCPLTFAT